MNMEENVNTIGKSGLTDAQVKTALEGVAKAPDSVCLG